MIYPVPRPFRPAPKPPTGPAVVFLPAAPPPPADTELPALVMAPLMPTGWPKS